MRTESGDNVQMVGAPNSTERLDYIMPNGQLACPFLSQETVDVADEYHQSVKRFGYTADATQRIARRYLELKRKETRQALSAPEDSDGRLLNRRDFDCWTPLGGDR